MPLAYGFPVGVGKSCGAANGHTGSLADSLGWLCTVGVVVWLLVSF